MSRMGTIKRFKVSHLHKKKQFVVTPTFLLFSFIFLQVFWPRKVVGSGLITLVSFNWQLTIKKLNIKLRWS